MSSSTVSWVVRGIENLLLVRPWILRQLNLAREQLLHEVAYPWKSLLFSPITWLLVCRHGVRVQAPQAPPYVSQRPSRWRRYQRTPITKHASRLMHASCYPIMQCSYRSPSFCLAPSQSSSSTVMAAFSLLYFKIKTKKEKIFFSFERPTWSSYLTSPLRWWQHLLCKE